MTEAQIHRQVADYLDTLQTMGRLFWFHPVNEGKRSVVAGANLKRLGMKKGVPDIAILLPEDHFAMIEIKSVKGRVSPPQALFMESAKRFCPNVFVARSFDEARHYIDQLVRAFPKREAA